MIWIGLLILIALGILRYYLSHPNWQQLQRTDALIELKSPPHRIFSEKIWFATQENLFSSENLLESVARELKLDETWKMELPAAARKIKDSLQIARIGESALFKISVRRADGQEANDIAGQIIKSYLQSITPERQVPEKIDSPAMAKEIEALNMQIKHLEEAQKSLGGNDLGSLKAQKKVGLREQSNLSRKIQRSTLALIEIKSELDFLKNQKDDQRFREAASLKKDKGEIAALHERIVALERFIETNATSGQGPDSREIIDSKSLLASLSKEIETTYQAFLRKLEGEISLEEWKLNEFTKFAENQDTELAKIAQKVEGMAMTRDKQNALRKKRGELVAKIARKSPNHKPAPALIRIHSVENVNQPAWRDWLESKAVPELLIGFFIVLLIPYFLELLFPARVKANEDF